MVDTSWSENVAKQWNRLAVNWDANSEEMWETGSRKTILPLLFQHVKSQSGSVLDAGCGAGYASCKMAEKGYQVEGVDISAEMIDLAQKRCSDRRSIRFQTADVGNLPFSAEHFAGILSINVVEFTESPLYTMQEFFRVLKPGAVLLLGILGPTAGPRGFSYRRLYGEKTIQNTMMPWEAHQLAQEIGFISIAEEPVYRDGVPHELAAQLSSELRQALSFLTVFVLEKPSAL